MTKKLYGVTLAERFMAKVNKQADGCWIWTASICPQGYGKFVLPGRGAVYAHRVSHELFKGPIPDGLHVDHLCRVRSCVNPEHLEAVPSAENNRRGISPCADNLRKDTCPRGHEYTHYTLKDGSIRRDCRTCMRLAQMKRYRINGIKERVYKTIIIDGRECRLCHQCGQPIKPKDVEKIPGEWDHAQGCQYANLKRTHIRSRNQ